MSIRFSVFIIINISLFSSCKTTSPCFNQFNLNKNEKYYVFNTHFTEEEVADIKRLYRAGVITNVMR